jgi:transposase
MKKLIRRAVRFKGLSLGLDVHKKFIEFCVLNRRGDEIQAGRVDSTAEALVALVARLKKQEPVQASLEACGCFIWIFDLLAVELGRDAVHVANPARLHVVANSLEKNDSNDAWWLAYALFEGRLPESFVAEGPLRDMRIAARELRAYTDARSDLLRRFKSHLAQAGCSVPKNWHASKVGRDKAAAVVDTVTGERQRALRMLMKQIKKLAAQVKHWRGRMEALSAALPQVKTMIDNLPGFGLIIAGTATAELGPPQRFYAARAYAKATGLPPGYRESGGKKEVTTMTREGSRHARWAFTRAIISCMRCKKGVGAQIKMWVQERSKHKPKKKVIVAAARKLAEGTWRLFALGEAFDLAKAFPTQAAPAG